MAMAALQAKAVQGGLHLKAANLSQVRKRPDSMAPVFAGLVASGLVAENLG